MRSHTDMNLLVLAKLIDKSTNMLPVEEFYHGNDICQSFHCSDNTGADTVFLHKMGTFFFEQKLQSCSERKGIGIKLQSRDMFCPF